MTDFGDPSSFAMMCFRNAAGKDSDKFDRPLKEYDEQELKLLLTYFRLAYKISLKASGATTAQQMLLTMHDAVFVRLTQSSRKFAALVLNNKHVYVGGHTKEQVKKYKKLAREGLSAH